MNIEETLQRAKSQFPIHTVDKEQFIQSFLTKIEKLDSTSTAKRKRRRLVVSGAAVILAGGVAGSPMVVSAIQKIPLVHIVLNWVEGTDAAHYVRNIQQSATSGDITMTITDVLYGPSQLAFGYIVSPRQSRSADDGSVALGSRDGTTFLVNGKQVQLQGMGSDEATAYGFKGLITLTDAGTSTTLPSAFSFQIIVHKIGHATGTWEFNVPVSRKNMAPSESFLPMITKQVGNQTITIKEVQLYPTGGMIDYDVTMPVGVKPSLNMMLFDQNKRMLDGVSATPESSTSHATQGNIDIWSYSQSFRIAGQMPTSLIINPTIAPAPEWRLYPVTGPFPVTMTSGLFGKLVITKVNIKGQTVTVHYKSSSGPSVITPGFGFSIRDITDPSEGFGGELGVKDGPSGSGAYMNVYQFSNNIGSDKLMLQLSPHTKDYVFRVPLGHNSR